NDVTPCVTIAEVGLRSVDEVQVEGYILRNAVSNLGVFVIPRSYLYVPGNDSAKLARAAERGADALIVDLEDAVPPSAKAEARTLVAEWLAGDRLPAADDGGPEVWVRV